MPDRPLVLAFDTSAAHCAAALLWGDEVLAGTEEPMARGQAERLLGLCEELLS
ncbi:MAG: tRNA (adenosine(37)-N6)-threonylcarbamoyltransferase complex dimerization subunit type 1 TsaB, partial [Sulfitobacter sp.]|nr:tRNA (adenosine(37)-N6)-threonylcarbamoyltransferase complex dimerization subunit type 1 TsaB [Sulfitobacter sp.]